jgi:hypothetical protein
MIDKVRRAIPWALGSVLVSICLALADGIGFTWQGWFAYLVICLISALLLGWLWERLAGSRAGRGVLLVMLVALALRLVVGAAFVNMLPSQGYDEKHHRAGYFFPDAYERDRDAWNLARSSHPVWWPFQHRYGSDQYGGMLALNSLVYRAANPDVHRPLVMVVLAAAASVASVLLGWAFVARVFGARAALLAAWILALFPDAVLLGSTQMREPFLMSAVGAAMLGYAAYREGQRVAGGGAIGIGILIAIVVSPPFSLIIIALVALAWIWEARRHGRWTGVVLVLLAVLLVLGTTLTIFAADMVTVGSSGLSVILQWLNDSAAFQLRKLEAASGWAREIFDHTPAWAHLPLATFNGLLQPFLPAALMDNSSVPLMRWIAVWRAAGWFTLLPFLIYAGAVGLRSIFARSLPSVLAMAVLMTTVLVSYREAGDQWDNPRYRTVFLVLQAALAGFGWMHARETKSPWLWRTIVCVAGVVLIFSSWYAGRYYQMPKLSFFLTLAVAVLFLVGYPLASWGWDVWRRRRRPA